VNIQRRGALSEKELQRLVTARLAGITWKALAKRFGMGEEALRKAYERTVKNEIR
jgi:hypothetical protein